MSGSERRVLRLMRAMALLPEEQRARVMKAMPAPDVRFFEEEWGWQAHRGQEEPEGVWRVWLMMAGRGFGKTRTGAEWVAQRAREHPEARIALVGATLDDVAKVMVGGPSGLLSVARTGEEPKWIETRGILRFPSGAEAFAYSGEKPDKLRGPEHDFAWCDEIAKWSRPDETWDNLQLTMRRGTRPRLVVTTTPKPVPLLRRIIGLDGTRLTGGRTADNLHLAGDFVAAMDAIYGGTRLGRQELEGLLIEDVEGALWTREMIEGCRVGAIGHAEGPLHQPSASSSRHAPGMPLGSAPPPRAGEDFLRRVVIGVDPPASADGTCGIVVCGLGEDERLYVLADHSVQGLRPEGWARAVARAAELWQADRIVAETNQGGDMVASVLRSAELHLPVHGVFASRGKTARAEPVATAFEAGRARLAGRFPELEDELAGMTAGGRYEGPGSSPDRADAMVWAMTELMKRAREPRVLML